MASCKSTMRTLAAVEKILGRKMTLGFCPQCKQKKPRADTGKCGVCVSKSVAEAEAVYAEWLRRKA